KRVTFPSNWGRGLRPSKGQMLKCSVDQHSRELKMQIADQLSQLNALSPLDGRYAAKGKVLRQSLSEAAFMAHRVEVEVAWLLGLAEAGLPELPSFSEASKALLKSLVAEFSEDDAARIKEIEKTTN